LRPTLLATFRQKDNKRAISIIDEVLFRVV
jgi:hypothetical protein